LLHGARQDDDRGEVDLGSEEANRRGRDAFAAAIAIAAEAEPESIGLGEVVGSAPRLARVVGGVKRSAAAGTTLRACGLGKVPVDYDKEVPDPGRRREAVVHVECSVMNDTSTDTRLGNLGLVIRLREGTFL
jgi:hypothetical protein